MKYFRINRLLSIVAAILVCGLGLSFQAPPKSADLTSDSLIQYLTQAIGWYRQLDSQSQMATDAEEGLVVHDNQQIANQVVSYAFDFARAEADTLEKEEASGNTGSKDAAGSARYLALRQTLNGLDQQIRTDQAELESLRQKLSIESGAQRESIQIRMDQTRSELELAQVRRDSLRSMTEFVAGTSANGLGATGVREKIEALARSVPAALAKPATKQEASATAAQVASAPVSGMSRSQPAGVWALTLDVFAINRRLRAVRVSTEMTDSLSQRVKDLRAPLVSTLREMSKRADMLAAQADTGDQIVLVQQKAMLDALTAQFKRTSDLVLPLSKQGILIELCRKNLTDWQGWLENRNTSELRELLARLTMLAAILAAIFGGAALWRRAIIRYVHDPRRRYQYLLLRKIVFWCVIATVLLFSFSNELSSVATFAGLITAGVAVALQSVILSVVAYFFLIGRYGITVGDRVQVAGVVGEVVDIGFVRFHLLELVSGGDKKASGRVVAFSNSIVFQSNAGFFKQIPGTSFVWHEAVVTVSPDGGYQAAEERLRGVVEAVFAEYRDEMEKQYRLIERTMTIGRAGTLQPTSRLQPAPTGLEVVIRYPVDLMREAEIDDRVIRELLGVLDREPKLKPAGSSAPPLRLRTDLSA